MSKFQNEIDELIEKLKEIRNLDVFKQGAELKKLEEENDGLKEKLKFFSKRSMTIDEKFINKEIEYEEYQKQLDLLLKMRNAKEFKK